MPNFWSNSRPRPGQRRGWGDAGVPPGQVRRQTSSPSTMFPPTGGEEPLPPVTSVQTPPWAGPLASQTPPGAPMPKPPMGGAGAFGTFGAPSDARRQFIDTLPPMQSGPLRDLLAQGVPFDQAYRMTMPRKV